MIRPPAAVAALTTASRSGPACMDVQSFLQNPLANVDEARQYDVRPGGLLYEFCYEFCLNLLRPLLRKSLPFHWHDSKLLFRF